jgi:hypothetical protein
MNVNIKLKSILNDAFFLDGDFLDMRVFNANTFMHLIAAAKDQKKIAYGMDTWKGLPAPTKKDLCISNYFLNKEGQFAVDKNSVITRLTKEMSDFHEYKLISEIDEVSGMLSVVVLDQILYEPTKLALEKIWNKMCYGGTIFIPNYQSFSFSADLAVTEFLAEKTDSLIANRQLIFNGTKETFLIVKCFNQVNKPINWDSISKRNEKKLTIAMVLKTGSVYDSKYVNALANGIRRNTTRQVEIVCITDNSTGFNSNIDRVIPFKHDFPKWWGKVELFRPDLFEDNRVFYIDLDTVIIDNIDEILDFQFDFCGLRDFYKMVSLGSGLMSWNSPTVHRIYNNFLEKSNFVMSTYTDGDQEWIDQHKPKTVYFQDIFPKEVISFKKDCQKQDGSIVIPPKAKIICFHGTPKPHNISNPAIKDHWVTE